MAGVRHLTKQDIADAARLIRVEPAALAAVINIECGWPRRGGFDNKGRLRILYEPHIAWRLLKDRPRTRNVLAERKVAGVPLAYTRWGKYRYPRTNGVRWTQLEEAIKLAGMQAYQFASYGLPQIMGFNYKAAGYNSARDMVESFRKGEREQIFAMARFIASRKGMLEALQKKQWARFAKYYNGSGYKKNRYDEKLRKAYARFSRQEWPEGRLESEYTPWKPAPKHEEKPDVVVEKKPVEKPAKTVRSYSGKYGVLSGIIAAAAAGAYAFADRIMEFVRWLLN